MFPSHRVKMRRFEWIVRWAVAICCAPSAFGVTKTYTTDANFDEGTLVNVNHDAPMTNQLQLDVNITPLPFVNVAASNRGAVVRIDVNTGEIVGEYATAPLGRGLNPSRTTVDLAGNVWAGNRAEASEVEGTPMGSVVKIGVVVGGTRVNADMTPNPDGEYLMGPFTYSTAEDRDNDGLIKTSRGLGDILSWIDGTDGDGGGAAGGPAMVEDADDELILVYQRVGGENIRQVSVDENNNIWTGANFGSNNTFSLLDGATGEILGETDFGAGGYGGLVDGNGVLWAASRTGSHPGLTSGVGLVRYDTNNTVTTADDSVSVLESPNSYGLGIDSGGNIWNAQFTSGTIRKFSAAGDLGAGFPKAVGGNGCRGVAVTSLDDDVWVANSLSHTVTRLDNDGNILKIIPVGTQPTGVAVDANGEVWVTNLSSNNVMRIDPDAGGDGLGAVDLTVDLGEDAGPYNYSDMTGFVAIGSTSQQGTWTVIYDSQEQGTKFDQVSWTSNEPAGTSLTVEVRAANTVQDLDMESFVSVFSGGGLTGIAGQFIEIEVNFTRTPGQTESSPVLFDLTVEGTLVSDCIPADTDCDGDVDGVDFAQFAACFNGSGKPPRTFGCGPEPAGRLDFEPDNDVDGVDFSKFAACFNGAGRPPRTLGCPGT